MDGFESGKDEIRTALSAGDPRHGTLHGREDYNGLVEIEARDPFGRVRFSVDPDTTRTTWAYHYLGQSSEDPLRVDMDRDHGPTVSEWYDAYGRLVRTESQGVRGQDLVSTTDYDDFDRPWRSTVPHDPTLVSASYATALHEYDVLGRPTKRSWFDQTGPSLYEPRQETGCYSGPISCARNARGYARCSVRDTLGRVIERYDPSDSVLNASCEDDIDDLSWREPAVRYGYSEFLERIQRPAQDPVDGPVVTAIMPDRYGRKRFLVDPDTAKTEYTYNGYDELISEIDANGRETRFSYDTMGRLITRTDVGMLEDGSDGITQWLFDGLGPDGDPTLDSGELVGKLTGSRSPEGHEKLYTYYEATASDPTDAGHLQEIIQTTAERDGVPLQSFSVEFLGYEGGRPTEIRYPDSGMSAPRVRVRRSFDDYGNLTSLQDAGDAFAAPYWHLDSTDAFGNIERETFGNGATSTSTFTRDIQRRLVQIEDEMNDEPLRSATYAYDANGNLTMRSNGEQTETFPEYDELDRLRRSQVGENARVTTYDPLGNIASRTDVGGYLYLTENDLEGGFDEDDQAELPGFPLFSLHRTKPHAVAITPDVLYGYDAVGNRTVRLDITDLEGVTYYSYTPFDKPSAMWRGTEDLWSATDLVVFDYDADERRIRKIALESATSDPLITNYVEGLYEQRVSSSDEVHIYYLWANGRVIGQLKLGPGDGDTDYQASYFHVDHLGSPELITEDDGPPVGSGYRSFSAFGEARHPFDWSLLIAPPDPSTIPNLGFTGHPATDRYGLIDMGGRQYDASIGVFTTADPFVQDSGFSQSYNRYAYVYNNPLAWVDPSGFQRYGHSSHGFDPNVEIIRFGAEFRQETFSISIYENGEYVGDYVETVGYWVYSLSSFIDLTEPVLRPTLEFLLEPSESKTAFMAGMVSEMTWGLLGSQSKWHPAFETGQKAAVVAGLVGGAGSLVKAGLSGLRALLKTGAKRIVSGARGKSLISPKKYFGGKTKKQVEAALEKKYGAPNSVRAHAKTYYNPKTKRSFNVHQEPGHRGGKPHVDIRRRGDYPERKFDLLEE